MATLNWVYGAKSPAEDITDRVNEQLKLAHVYRNRLCELERQKRDRYYDLLRQYAPDFVAAEHAVETLEQQLGENKETIQKARKDQRTKKPTGMDDVIAKIADIKVELKAQRAARKEAKEAATEIAELQDAVQSNQQQHKDEAKQARKDSGLYWGTAAVVDQAAKSMGSGAPPKFFRYQGEGQLGVQLSGGLPVSDALTGDTRCHISGTGRRRTLYFRVGSEGRSPVFATVPLVFHRDLPEGGKIKWAYLEKRRMADRFRWSCRLTIDVPKEPVEADTSKWAALHIGWHKVPSGMQVAVWKNHAGKAGRLVLPNSHLADYDRLAEIQRYRDTALQDAIAVIKSVRDTAPDWFKEATTHAHQWKTFARVVGLLRLVSENEWTAPDVKWPAYPVELSRRIVPRKCDRDAVVKTLQTAGFVMSQVGGHPDYWQGTRDGVTWSIRISNHTGYMPDQTKNVTLSQVSDVDLFLKSLAGGSFCFVDTLQRMSAVDRLLWRHHARLSARVAKRRNCSYRELAAGLASDSDVVYYGKPDTARLTKNAEPEELTEDESRIHRQLRQAATSELLRFVREKFSLRYAEVDVKHLTQQCSHCGELASIEDRYVVCECGQRTDQEINALHNTIARGHVMVQDGVLLALEEAEAAKQVKAAARLKKMQDGRRKKLAERTARKETI